MIEKTLVLIKPDSVEQDVWFDIMQIYLKNGLEIKKAKILKMDKKLAEDFYAEHKGKDFFERHINHMTSGSIVALVVFGENAVQEVRELNGSINPAKAKNGTIRSKYGKPNGGPINAVHGSDSKETSEREINFIFES